MQNVLENMERSNIEPLYHNQCQSDNYENKFCIDNTKRYYKPLHRLTSWSDCTKILGGFNLQAWIVKVLTDTHWLTDIHWLTDYIITSPFNHSINTIAIRTSCFSLNSSRKFKSVLQQVTAKLLLKLRVFKHPGISVLMAGFAANCILSNKIDPLESFICKDC